VDEWGVFWSKPEEGGHFIFRDGPFQKKDPTLAEVEAHPWPNPKDPERVKGLREQAQKLRNETDYAIVLRLPYGTVYDCQKIRGFAQFLEDLVINPALAEALMEHSLMVEMGIVELALEAIGEYVDVVCFPDDLGFQDRPYVRPELYRKMIKPYHRRTVETIRSNTKAKVLMHTDGAVYPLIPDFIDIGVDILNPVQISAKDMEARRLKTEFGADISFWGGIDTHRVLPTGTPAEVRNEVKERIEDFAPGGGFVLGSVHNILAEVPAENVVVMFDSALEYGNYR
jgi:uroporphyrinogen decarboxylase